MSEQRGPRIGLTSPRYYTTCSGCKYHKHTLVKSGHDPIYRDDCVHESAPDKRMKLSFTGNLRSYDHNVEPGDWCPFEPVNQVNIP
ncbi:MAG: hypothetical protein JWQ66_2921 [Mucilaginibacter sp.]|nr:hypothetical protein [Mucilaginibacter sp.]